MKNRNIIILFLIIILGILSLNVVQVSGDLNSQLNDINNQIENNITSIQNTINNAPKTPEEIRDRYLKQEWNKIISKTPYLGQVHNFLIANPIIFQILFHEKYSFSLTFFGIMFIWIFFFIMGRLASTIYFKGVKTWISGLLFAIAISWVGLTNFLVQKIFYLIFSQSAWWMRALLWILAFVIFAIWFKVEHSLAIKIKAANKINKELELTQSVKKLEARVKGQKEADKAFKD